MFKHVFECMYICICGNLLSKATKAVDVLTADKKSAVSKALLARSDGGLDKSTGAVNRQSTRTDNHKASSRPRLRFGLRAAMQ